MLKYMLRVLELLGLITDNIYFDAKYVFSQEIKISPITFLSRALQNI